MITKHDFIELCKKEFATTLKVMNAYPTDKMDFAPHERSQSAKRLMATFVFELYLLRSYVLGEPVGQSVFQSYAKETVDELVADFKKETEQVFTGFEHIDDAAYNRTIEFAGRTFSADQFSLMMLFDQIHHRGQLSVYIRLAGGKVPSIYGPSADDPGTNL